MAARVTWAMPAEFLAQARQCWPRIDAAIKAGILAGEILLSSKLKTDYLSGDPIHRRSGNLSRGVFYDPTSVEGFSGYLGVVGIGAEVPYARGLNDGNPPHIIRAQEGRFLRFEIDGEILFRREVNHPGNEPFRFMERDLADNTPAVTEGISTRVVTAIRTSFSG